MKKKSKKQNRELPFKMLGIFLMIFIVCAVSVFAVSEVTTYGMGTNQGSSGGARFDGYKIVAHTNLIINNATKVSGCSAIEWVIIDMSNIVLSSGNMTGNLANINYELTAGQTVYILLGSRTGAYNIYGQAGSILRNNTLFESVINYRYTSPFPTVLSDTDIQQTISSIQVTQIQSINPSISISNPLNNSLQFVKDFNLTFGVNVLNLGGSYFNVTENIYTELGSLYLSLKNSSSNFANFTNIFKINDAGIYYINASVTNGTYVLNTSRYIFTLYNITVGNITIPVLNQNISSYINFSWLNSTTTNNSVYISNYSLNILNTDYSLNKSLAVVTANNYSFYSYFYNLSIGTYRFQIVSFDVRNNSVNVSQSFNIIKDSQLNITAYDVITNQSINNLVMNLSDLSSGSSELLNVSGYVLSVDIVKGHSYSAYFDVVGYSIHITNFSANTSTYQYLNQSLYKSNSVLINVFDEGSLSLITNSSTGAPVNITLISNTTALYFNTTTGSLFLSNITTGFYEVKFNAPLYAQRSYFITISDRSTQSLSAYLSQSAITLLLTYVNKETGEFIEGAGVNVYKIINGTWTAVASGFTDITGRFQVSVSTNTNYRFSSSIEGYTDKTFNLNPVIFTSYTIQISKLQSSGSQLDFSNINVFYENTTFRNNGTNKFLWTISAPSGNLINYAYSLSTKCKNITSFSGSNAIGGINYLSFNLSCASIYDEVVVNYNYTLSGGDVRSFSHSYSILGNSVQPNFAKNNSEHYGMGMIERILLVVIITIIFAGVVTKFSNIVAGLVSALFIMSYLSYIGFIEWWLIAPSLLVGFIILTSWNTK